MTKIISLMMLATLFIEYVWAENSSMRKCMLLPITDNINGSLAFPVFNEVERFLKESHWCYYKYNSDILNILKKYKHNLHLKLRNEEVLQLLAKKVNVGSLIRINLEKDPNGVLLEMSVIGENGKDFYFKEKKLINSDDAQVVATTINNYLNVYERQIPYEGKVIAVLGDQFTIDIGKTSYVKVGQKINVFRASGKKTHPLLKEIVEWEKIKLASGTIFNVSEYQAQGLVKTYESKQRLRKGDWVTIDKEAGAMTSLEDKFPKVEKDEFGKLGVVQTSIDIGSGSDATFDSSASTSSSTTKKVGGFVFGLNVRGEVFATRNWWGALEIGKKFGTYKEDIGTVQSGNNSISITSYKVQAGHKFLPMGYFYGPQVDLIVGYQSYNYNIDTSTTDGFGESTFSGLSLGVRGNAPIVRDIRGFIEFDFVLGTDYEEEIQIYGASDSTSQFQFEGGVHYELSPNMSLDGSFELTSSKAKFESPTREIHFKTSAFKLGTTFAF